VSFSAVKVTLHGLILRFTVRQSYLCLPFPSYQPQVFKDYFNSKYINTSPIEVAIKNIANDIGSGSITNNVVSIIYSLLIPTFFSKTIRDTINQITYNKYYTNNYTPN